MTEKRFLVIEGDYGINCEMRIADLNSVEKTKEDFWDDEEECYDRFEYYGYLCDNEAFLTVEGADKILNELAEENEQLIQQNDKLIRLIEDLGHDEMERQMDEILNDY